MLFRPLCGFAYRYVNDNQICEDLVQDAFVNFWKKIEHLPELNQAKAYLYTSVRNGCLNHLKHQGVKTKHESSLIYELESEQFLSTAVVEEEVFAKLHGEIKKLPEALQKIMLLAMNGLKNGEIAEELGISENTVKTQKKIGYAKMREHLGPVLSAIFFSF